MKIEFNNLYTHFVFITHLRQPVIPEKNRIEIEKYITGIVKNNLIKTLCHLCQPRTCTLSCVKSTHFIGGRTGNPEHSNWR